MQKKDRRAPDEIAKDLEEIVLPEINEEDLEDAYGGITREETTNSGCGC